ncbi:hypothetical protein BV20DRAFT_964928 [Pilatotrama ljubarskyi]|nr:hypothetical protein BV20DRAFT_964928 [Pilatotrama ljubarskyi]
MRARLAGAPPRATAVVLVSTYSIGRPGRRRSANCTWSADYESAPPQAHNHKGLLTQRNHIASARECMHVRRRQSFESHVRAIEGDYSGTVTGIWQVYVYVARYGLGEKLHEGSARLADAATCNQCATHVRAGGVAI